MYQHLAILAVFILAHSATAGRLEKLPISANPLAALMETGNENDARGKEQNAGQEKSNSNR